jgi:hypothetical protein
MNKTNKCTEFQFYWYDDSTCFGQPFCPPPGILSCTSALVHYMELWWPYATRSTTTAYNVPKQMYGSELWWWTEKLPETCRVVIPIKVEFSASVGFINFKAETCSTFWTKKDIVWNCRSDWASFCLFLLIKTLCLTLSQRV